MVLSLQLNNKNIEKGGMDMKPIINAPISKDLFASLFTSLTLFLASPFVEASTACVMEKQERYEILNQFPTDIKEAIMPSHTSYYLATEKVAKDLTESMVTIDIANPPDRDTFKAFSQRKTFGTDPELNQDIMKIITSFKRELNQKEREILARYLYGYTLSGFSEITAEKLQPLTAYTTNSAESVMLSSLKAYATLTANPFDKEAFLQKHEEFVSTFLKEKASISDISADQMISLSQMFFYQSANKSEIRQNIELLFCKVVITIAL